MNRKEAAELLPIIKAFAEGKNIECRRKPSAIKGTNVSNDWVKVRKICFSNDIEYRIKPILEYRPFVNTKECWQEMQRHQPFGWLKSKEDENRALIIMMISERDIFKNSIGGSTMYELMEKFTFDDGAVFGILKEE